MFEATSCIVNRKNRCNAAALAATGEHLSAGFADFELRALAGCRSASLSRFAHSAAWRKLARALSIPRRMSSCHISRSEKSTSASLPYEEDRRSPSPHSIGSAKHMPAAVLATKRSSSTVGGVRGSIAQNARSRGTAESASRLRKRNLSHAQRLISYGKLYRCPLYEKNPYLSFVLTEPMPRSERFCR